MFDEPTPSEDQAAKAEDTLPPLAKVLSIDEAVELRAKHVAEYAGADVYSWCLSTGRDSFRTMRLCSYAKNHAELNADKWNLAAHSRPTVETRTSIRIGPSTLGRVPTDTPPGTILDEDGKFMRIGSTFYREDNGGSFVQFSPLSKTSWSRVPERVSGMVSRGDVLFVAGRKPIERQVDTRSDEENFTCDDSDEESDVSSVDSNDEAYESWSECSDDESVRDYDSDKSSIKEADEDEGVGEDEDSEEKDDNEAQAEESVSSSEGSDAKEDGSDGDSNKDDTSEVDESLLPSRASISVFTPNGRSFHRSQKVVPPLFDSPPVIHPTKPLVVWPLGESDVLFGNWEAKTFYTRSAWSMGYASRNLFMKCHFSPCGRYIHVACLDGERTDGDDDAREPGLHDPMKLTLAVYTHRLCELKPSRCRPTLMHAVWIELGTLECINFDRSPCTLTWTDEHLYAALSDTAVRVFRIPLFHQPSKKDDPAPQAYKPQQLITLPDCARSRQVLFFPAAKDGTIATIVIGAPLVKKGELVTTAREAQAAVPLAFRVDEQEDFGGWVDYKPPEKDTEGESDESKEAESA